MGIPEHLNCLLRNLYVGQEATVRTLYGKLIGSRSRKEYDRAVCCHTCLFNLYAEHIMKNARLDELQAGIKIGRRNINNLRYVDDTTVTTESEEELKSLLIRMKKERERYGLKLKKKKKISWHLVPLLQGK